MDLGCEVLNNLISKDSAKSRAAAESIVNNADVKSYEKLCEKSEFLFDFIKENIIEKLAGAVNKENFENVFKFIKIYNQDFEDFITRAWLKFADEDLTDEILNILENGADEEKTYAAAYFYHINDPLALPFLKEYVFSDFDPLAQNSARALSKFEDTEIFNKAINVIKSDADDFEKYKYVNFLVSYGDKKGINPLYEYFNKSYAKGYIASNILYLKSLMQMTEDNEQDMAYKIFDAILGSYPEEISLDTVFDFEILNFIKYLSRKTGNSYINRLLLKAKYKFNFVSREDIYTFDLNKNVKKEINEISGFLNSIKADLFDGLDIELKSDDRERVIEAYDVILNFGKKEFTQDIKNVVQNTEYEDLIAEGIKVLKAFGALNLILKDEILSKIKNENIKAIILSTFS